jgi:hypothetical protein
MRNIGTRAGARSAGRRHGRERGVAIIEFAIVAPLLFALLLGTFTGALALSRKNAMLNSTREGARLGATIPAGATWANSVRDRVVGVAGSDLTAAGVCVRLRTATGPSSSNVVWSVLGADCAASGEPALPAGLIAGDCVVTVWTQRQTQFETVFFSRAVTLRASAVARFERGRGATCVP